MAGSKKYSYKIFLADDDADDRELFQEAIRETTPQSSILTFNDGNKLIEYLGSPGSPAPDIIFLDINMPVKNGKECLSDIRKTPRFNHIPIIIFSTSLDNRDINDTFMNGANLFISKPGSFRNQVEMFNEVFDLYSKNKLLSRTMASFVLPPPLNRRDGLA